MYLPILAQCSISIPPKSVRKTKLLGFLTFLGGIRMEHWAICINVYN